MSDAQSIALDDHPELLVELAASSPETVLQWVYDGLGLPESTDLDIEWIESIRRGALASSGGVGSPELHYALQLVRYPVSITEFLFGRKYLHKSKDEIFPEVLRELGQINNPDGVRILNPYTELVATGGIGSAKSTTALYTVAYQLYVLSCFSSPHETFGLDRASEIVFVFVGMSGDSAETDYNRFYQMVKDSPYFKSVFPYNPRLKSELHFPHNIQVKTEMTAIGQNLMGGLLDEVNFGQIIKDSKRAVDGGIYNQTLQVYDSISRRRKSRFQSGGRTPGILCLVSSKRYPGEFTDTKLEEAKTDPSIYVYDKRVWDVKPPGSFSSQTFQVYPGTGVTKPRVIDPGEQVTADEQKLLINVPIDFKKEFTTDLIGSLRDIAGVSTLARYPFFQDLDSVSRAFGRRRSILSAEVCDLKTTRLQWYPREFVDTQEVKYARWCHIDLGVTSDAAGIACGYVKGFKMEDEIGMMPIISLDFILRVPPPPAGEILFSSIRRLILGLRQSGLPIKWVTFDSFQSVDSIQILRSAGFVTGVQSMDKTNSPYSITKTAFYGGRVLAPKHAVCQNEIGSLEKDAKSGKIDHPPSGSKDCADAVAGVIAGLTVRREIWLNHNVPFSVALALIKESTLKENEPNE